MVKRIRSINHNSIFSKRALLTTAGASVTITYLVFGGGIYLNNDNSSDRALERGKNIVLNKPTGQLHKLEIDSYSGSYQLSIHECVVQALLKLFLRSAIPHNSKFVWRENDTAFAIQTPPTKRTVSLASLCIAA